MKQEKAFLQAIVKNPDDDTSRLVYADWLEEQGDAARAEFIRVQIELARGGVPAARRRQLKARERELFSRHKNHWDGGVLCEIGSWHYRRGIVESIRTARRFSQKRANEIFRLYPIRKILFDSMGEILGTDVSPFIRWLANWPALARVESLAFWGDSGAGETSINRAELSVLLASRRLRRLRYLDISDNDEMDGIGEDLAGSRVLKQLTALTLLLVGADVVAHLAASRYTPRLTRLTLPDNGLDAGAMVHMAGWPAVAKLKWLDLRNNSIGPEGAEALAASPYLRQLHVLDLSQFHWHEPGRIGDRGLRALVSSGKLDGARRLALVDNGIGPEGARMLTRLGELRSLDLRGNGSLGTEGMRALAGSANLAGLRRLDVGICDLGDAGARALARSSHLHRLIELTAYVNDISDAGVRALASSSVLDRVRLFGLGGNRRITDAGARALARSRHLEQLERLDLGTTGIGPEGQRLLRERFGTRVVFR
jgi:uncharacterized protein (TIGR02996 family)